MYDSLNSVKKNRQNRINIFIFTVKKACVFTGLLSGLNSHHTFGNTTNLLLSLITYTNINKVAILGNF